MKIAVIGELNVDIIVTGKDVMPAWNREKLVETFDVVMGSSSAITAAALASLGAEVKFVSIVGDDDFGRLCIRELGRLGVDTSGVLVDPALKTGVTLSLSTPQDRGLLTFPGTIPLLNPSQVPDSLLGKVEHVHFGSYFLQDGMRPHWAELFRKARALGASTSFDTGWDVSGTWERGGIDRLLPETDLFLPSEEEFLQLYPAESLDAAWRLLPEGTNAVAVKRGGSGASLYRPEEPVRSVPAFAVEVADTTGAGDNFNAGAIFAYRRGLRGEELLRFACACGAIAVQGVGGTGQLATVAEAERLIREGEARG
ncbi:carbohydrate kinase family protein [Cohnella sp. REN36]|uniref:carbohydrate kinase family protein n=1 Tax=Cohnella sp. REN36 TaxID=2887347 RepID=UPI001D142430|nr:sugar kinase [Cohnella sp. REN36]MCC3375142.1 sugar kinase [Cohnella sp. REN36]